MADTTPATPAFTADYTDFLSIPDAKFLDVLADQLELQLNGGQATDDSPYAWPYCRLCVQQAFDVETAETETKNLALLQADYLTRKKDETESYFLDMKARTEFWETPERWIQTFPAPLLYDKEREEQYFLLPAVFVNLRRYQNLPAEDGVRDIVPRNRVARSKYRFAYVPSGANTFRSLPGGLLGRWGFYREQTNGILLPAVDERPPGTTSQHRVYLVAPRPGQRVPDDVALNQVLVIRDNRTSGLPAPPLLLVQAFNIQRRALETALLRTRSDKDADANPTPTQTT